MILNNKKVRAAALTPLIAGNPAIGAGILAGKALTAKKAAPQSMSIAQPSDIAAPMSVPTPQRGVVRAPQSSVPTAAANTSAQQNNVIAAAAPQETQDQKAIREAIEQRDRILTRPITPAPTMLRDAETSTPLSDEDIQRNLLKKSLSRQYGDSLSDQELDFLARQQMQTVRSQDEQLSAFQKAQEAQLARLAEITSGQEQRLSSRQAEEEERNKRILESFRGQEEAAAQEQIQLAQRFGSEQQAVSERLLGTRGNLTSTVGTQSIERIQRETNSTVSAITAAKNAAIQLRQAQLEGASEEVIDALRDDVVRTQQAEQEAILRAETDLQNAKLAAMEAGDTARQQMIQGALDNLSLEKAASKADAALTKNIGDGFIYDEFGQRIADAEGNLMTYSRPEELSELELYSAKKAIDAQFVLDKDAGKAAAGMTPEAMQNVLDRTDRIKTIAQRLYNSPALPAAVGPLSRWLPSFKTATGETKDFAVDFEQLKSLLTLDNLKLMTGVLTDKDIELLTRAATNLDRGTTEGKFKAELENIFSTAEETQQRLRTGTPSADNQQVVDILTEELGRQPTAEEIQQILDFNVPLSTGLKGSDVTSINEGARVSTAIGNAIVTGIKNGSPLWKWGYDIVLEGGKGASVKSPVSGIVVKSGFDGGFGNRTGVKDAQGRIWYMGHLDALNVKEGERIPKLATLGTQGNTGKTLGKTGIHVDITVQKPDGSYYTSQEVASLLNTRLA